MKFEGGREKIKEEFRPVWDLSEPIKKEFLALFFAFSWSFTINIRYYCIPSGGSESDNQLPLFLFLFPFSFFFFLFNYRFDRSRMRWGAGCWVQTQKKGALLPGESITLPRSSLWNYKTALMKSPDNSSHSKECVEMHYTAIDIWKWLATVLCFSIIGKRNKNIYI